MSEYVQKDFSGGMNLLSCDTELEANQYRLGLNVRNRFGNMEATLSSVEDVAIPAGVKQESVTFGNYLIVFIAGLAYYRFYLSTGWKNIVGFQMSSTAPRFWTESVPLSTTNYGRFGVQDTTLGAVSANAGIVFDSVAGAFAGNTPGLVVQDNVNQPQFIYIDPILGTPIARTTQTFAQWDVDYSVTPILDKREYVPIGNAMAWVDGVLHIASQDGNFLYRSVSGRPLDFVVNVDDNGDPGGDATTTSYSVGVGNITALRAAANNSLLVTASNAVFNVAKNMTPGAVTIFGEYTFIRTFLFNAVCLSDRCIIDSLGDTRFISLTGVRSFNSILQQQNEGRNSLFSAQLQSVVNGIIQSAETSAAMLFDNYELYAINTVFGPVIAVFDTLMGCWVSFDIAQTGGRPIKMFAKIELTIQRLYAITDDNRLFTLYIGPALDQAVLRPGSMCAANVTANGSPIMPEMELKLKDARIVLDTLTATTSATVTPFVNNRLTQSSIQTKTIPYSAPTAVYTGVGVLPDTNVKLFNAYFSFPNTEQGWKVYAIITWTGTLNITQIMFSFVDQKPINPLQSQS